MRKQWISALMIPLLLLGACGEREAAWEDGFSSFRTALNAASRVTAVAELTADYGGTAEEYGLLLEYDGRETAVELTAPEILSGIRATAARGQTELCYDGVILGAGPLDETGLTPMSALPAILNAMAGGYVELLWKEGGFITARIYVAEGTVCTLWLEAQSLVPAAAELASDGRTVITCRFTDWKIT